MAIYHLMRHTEAANISMVNLSPAMRSSRVHERIRPARTYCHSLSDLWVVILISRAERASVDAVSVTIDQSDSSRVGNRISLIRRELPVLARLCAVADFGYTP